MHHHPRVAAGLAALVLVSGCSAQPSGTGPTASPAAKATSSASAKPCQKTDMIDLAQVTTAPSTRWRSIQGAKIPITTAGPFVVDDYRQTCFSPSLEGAVAAAGNLMARGFRTGPMSTWVMEHNTEPALTSAQIAEQATNQPPWPTVTKFKVAQVSEDGKNVTVDLGVDPGSESGSQAVGIGVALVWTGTDWKLDGDKVVEDSETITDLTDFTPWS